MSEPDDRIFALQEQIRDLKSQMTFGLVVIMCFCGAILYLLLK